MGILLFLGTALYAFFQVFPTQDAADMLSGVKKAEQILPFFIVKYLPNGVTGLVIGAAAAAAMSSLDSSINAISTIGVHDFYRRLYKKNESDKHYLKIARILATIASLIMIIGAILLTQTETKTLQHIIVTVISVLMGGLMGLFMLGFLTQRGDEKTAWFGIILTLVFSTWSVLSGNDLLPGWLSIPFDMYYTGLIGNILIFVSIFLIYVLLFAKKRDLPNLTIWTQKDKVA